jgi:hypothetical protein
MSKIITISDELAARLEERRRLTGQKTLDDVAASAITEGLAGDDDEIDPNCGYTVDELRGLIAEGVASGPAEVWSPDELTAEVRRRNASQRGRTGQDRA